MTEVHSDDSSDALITLGTINGVYGVQGWVKVYSFTSPIENILKYKSWQLSQKNQNKTVRVESGKKHGKGIIAKLEGYNDRDQAAALLKSEIRVSKSLLPELPSGEYYWTDLIGLRVTNLANIDFGIVDHLFETGANDVMVVKGESERLIPFVQGQYIKEIDLKLGTVLVDWPEDFE